MVIGLSHETPKEVQPIKSRFHYTIYDSELLDLGEIGQLAPIYDRGYSSL